MKQTVAILVDGRQVPGELVKADWGGETIAFTRLHTPRMGAMLSRAYQARKKRIEQAFGAAIEMFRYVDVGSEVEKKS